MNAPVKRWNWPVITRQDAIDLGTDRYFTDEPCDEMGHISPRWVKSKKCCACVARDAKIAKSPTTFEGAACAVCGSTTRYISSKHCRKCQIAAAAARQKKCDPVKRAAQQAAYWKKIKAERDAG